MKHLPGIAAQDLVKRYSNDTLALDGVSFILPQGTFCVIQGPSGSGKTTLLGILGGLEPPDRGRVYLDGEEITGRSRRWLAAYRRAHIGFVFQDFKLIQTLTAGENVALAYRLAGAGGHSTTRAREALEGFGLARQSQRRPGQLSGGEQQRVAMARALAGEPPVILADEPTANLDSRTGHHVILQMQERVHRTGATALLSSHDPRLADLADVVLHLEDGALSSERRRSWA